MFKDFSGKKIYTMVFAAVFVCTVMMSALSIPSAKANPIIVEVSPTSGEVGTSLRVSGSGATEDGEVKVYLAWFFAGSFAATTVANPTGVYSTDITVPAFPVGTYSILVLDVTTGDTAVAPFTIQPDINLTSVDGAVNDEVTVKGYGFNGGSSITLMFNGIDVTPWPNPQTDGFGSFEAKFRVPKVPKGEYTINASDGADYALASLTVVPKITLNPTSGPSAATVFVNGTGFASNAAVSIEFDNINVTMYAAFPTEIDGSFVQLFFVPDVADGAYTVNATDEHGNSAIAPFLVPSPTLTLEPSTAFGTSIVTAEGAGFPIGQPVLLVLEDNTVVELVDLMTGSEALFADEYGEYEYSFIVPVTTPGAYRVVAYSLAGFGFEIDEELASASLTIVDDAILVEIEDKIATIIIPDLGTIKQNLTAIDAELVSIEGNIATINSTMGVIQADLADIQLNITEINGNMVTVETTLGTIDGKITSIEGETATIETEVGTIKTDISSVKRTQEAFNIPLYTGLGLALIAAVGAIFLTIIHVQAMRKTAA